MLNIVKEGRVLLNDYLGWGWDAATRLYAITENQDGEPVSTLVHTFTDDPVDMIEYMLTTGHFTTEVKAIAMAHEAWRHPDLEEVVESGVLEEIDATWRALGKDPIPREDAEKWTREVYDRITRLVPPSQNKYRIETKAVLLLTREGEHAFLSLDRPTERITVFSSDEVDAKIGGRVVDALKKLFGPSEKGNPSE